MIKRAAPIIKCENYEVKRKIKKTWDDWGKLREICCAPFQKAPNLRLEKQLWPGSEF
jgi:hypothetical protein